MSRPRCACCGFAFDPDYRNKGKTDEGKQRYCQKEACREESRRATQAQHRAKEPEDLTKVKNRVAKCRAGKKSKRLAQTLAITLPVDSDRPPCSKVLPVVGPQDFRSAEIGPLSKRNLTAALAKELRRSSYEISSVVVRTLCNETAARSQTLSQSASSRNLDRSL